MTSFRTPSVCLHKRRVRAVRQNPIIVLCARDTWHGNLMEYVAYVFVPWSSKGGLIDNSNTAEIKTIKKIYTGHLVVS